MRRRRGAKVVHELPERRVRRVRLRECVVCVEDVAARRVVRGLRDARVVDARAVQLAEELVLRDVVVARPPHRVVARGRGDPREELVLAREEDDAAGVAVPVEHRLAEDAGVAQEAVVDLLRELADGERDLQGFRPPALPGDDLLAEVRERRLVGELRLRDLRRVAVRLVGVLDELPEERGRPALLLHPVRDVALRELREGDDLDRPGDALEDRVHGRPVLLADGVVVADDDDVLPCEPVVLVVVPLVRPAARVARRNDAERSQGLAVLFALDDVDLPRLDDSGEVVEKVRRVLVEALVLGGALDELLFRALLLIAVDRVDDSPVLVRVVVGRGAGVALRQEHL